MTNESVEVQNAFGKWQIYSFVVINNARLPTWDSAWHVELVTHSGWTLNFLQIVSRKAIFREVKRIEKKKMNKTIILVYAEGNQ